MTDGTTKWVPAKIISTESSNDYIWVNYLDHDNKRESAMISKKYLAQKIRLIGIDNIDKSGHDKPSNDKPSNDKPSNDKPGNDKPGNDKPGNDKSDHCNDKSSNNTDTTQHTEDETETNHKKIPFKKDQKVQLLLDNDWINGKITYIFNTTGIIKVEHNYNGDTEAVFVYRSDWHKKLKIKSINAIQNYSEKPMSEWTKNDVRCWVESVPAFKKYAKSFSKTMDGKELLDTTKDDLALIISSKFQRNKFMQKLESAKAKYNILHTNNAENDENDENDDNDEKESTNCYDNGYTTNKTNHVVGLRNLGNTCFLNTSIQLLSQTPYLTRYLKKRAKSHHFINAKESGFWETAGRCITSRSMDAYYKQNEINDRLMLNSWTDLCDVIYNQPRKYSTNTYNPKNIRTALHNIDEDFGSGEQDDSVRSLTIMLEALDSEIEDEINQNKSSKNKSSKNKSTAKYMDKYQLKHGNKLSLCDENKVIKILLNKHNPNNSIVRKSFDGVERLEYECLHCNEILQQYVIFRDLNLPVVSHDVVFENINIIFNNNNYTLEKCTVINYCSIDVLKYEIIQFLDQEKEEKIDIREIDIITLSNNGTVKHFDSTTKISELQQSNDNILVLVNNNHSPSEFSSQTKLLQFKIFIDKNGEQSISHFPQSQYSKYNQNTLYKLLNQQIKQREQKCNYVVYYNGKLLVANLSDSKKAFTKTDFQNIHHQQSDINILFLLCIDVRNNTFDLNLSNIDTSFLARAAQKYSNCPIVNALKQLKQSLSKTFNNFNDFGLVQLQHKSQTDHKSEINRINNTINELTKQKNICQFIQNWLRTNYKSKVSSSSKQLSDIKECVQEYQKTVIVDNTVFGYKCIHCKRDCKWTKISKKIVFTPPILILHLDRFGKNMESNSRSRSQKSFKVGQQIGCKYRNGKFYSATVIQVKSNGIRVRYSSDDEEQWVGATNYWRDIQNMSSSNETFSLYRSNKFEHSVKYDYKLQINNNGYELYGISNHTGTTKGGHYTATIKSDDKWYNISDSHVGNGRVNPLRNKQSATILMYSTNQI